MEEDEDVNLRQRSSTQRLLDEDELQLASSFLKSENLEAEVSREKRKIKAKKKDRPVKTKMAKDFVGKTKELIDLITPEKRILIQYMRQTMVEIKKSKLNYCLGFFACFLVVMVVALMLSILNHAPIVFTRLAELEEGEIDITIQADTSRGYRYVNHTAVSEVIDSNSTTSQTRFKLHSPRFEIRTNVAGYSLDRCNNSGIEGWTWNSSYITTPNTPYITWPYQGLPSSPVANVSDCVASQSAFSFLCADAICGRSYRMRALLVDSKREHDMGVGLQWPLYQETEIPLGTVFMYDDLAEGLRVNEGDYFLVRVDLAANFAELWTDPYNNFMSSHSINSTSAPWSWQYVYIPLKVGRIYDSSLGKHSVDISDMFLVEYSTFIPLVADHLHPDTPQDLRDAFAAIDLRQYAKTVIFNFPAPRYDMYTNDNGDKITEIATDFASQLLYRLGFDQVQADMPVLEVLDTLKYFNMFLGLILNVIVFILLFLSILLIYSLLMVSVETRTFEMGIMRMVGATRKRIVQLILCQAFSYALPSWLLGLFCGQMLMFVASFIFEYETKITITAVLTFRAIFVSSFLGFVIPLASSILPIRTALGKNVLDAIDTKHSKTQAIEIQIERSEDAGTPFSLIAVGASLTLFGFGIYYLIPLALLAENLALLVNVFFSLLICMLLGLVLLSINLQHLYEKAIVAVFFFWEKPALTSITLKNLVAHRRRNRKTAIMYALAIGFIIFMYTAYRINIQSILYRQQMRHGSILSLYTYNGDMKRTVPDLESYMLNSPFIKEWAWQSQRLRTVSGDNVDYITNIGHVFKDGQYVYGISPNLFDVVEQGFTNIAEMNTSSPYSILEQLYTVEGSGMMVMGHLYKKYLALGELDGTSNSRFILQQEYEKTVSFTVMKPLAYMDAAPIFKFSQFPNSKWQDALVSLPTFLRLCRGRHDITRIEDIPMKAVYLLLEKDISDEDMTLLKGDLGRILQENSANDVVVYDYNSRTDIVNLIDIAITFFFGFTIVIAMLICSFSLISAMYTNVYEQAKEIGVLRALGTTNSALIKIYIYEAFTLVFSSSLMGIIIGTGVAWIISVQRFLFTQIPVPFAFPWVNTSVVLFISILSAVFASWGPSSRLLKNPIVQILRMI